MAHITRAPGPPESAESPFLELKRFVGFGPQDEAELAVLRPHVEAAVDDLVAELAGPIAEHEETRALFAEPQLHVGHLSSVLAAWLRHLLDGPWDDSYPEERNAIRDSYLEQQLPQRYFLGIYDVIRRWLARRCIELYAADPPKLGRTLEALQRALDIDMAVMLAAHRDDLLARIKRHERLAMLGELSAGILHELKNPLAAIGATAFALGERRTLQADPRARELMERLVANVDRSAEIVGRMLSLTRVRDPDVHQTTVDDIVKRALRHCRVPAGHRITVDLDPALPDIRVDGAQIEQVVLNLLDNAFDACKEGGEIRIVGRLAEGEVRLAVADDGVGVAASDLRRVFEPLFSTKPEGTGLGLALSRRLVEANGGAIELTSEAGRGTTVTLSFAR